MNLYIPVELMTVGKYYSVCKRKVKYAAVALLGWVTPGAATEGVIHLFFPEKPGDLFCSSLSLSLSLFIAFTPFLPVRPRFSTILCKFAHKFFPSGVTPLEGVTRGGPPP